MGPKTQKLSSRLSKLEKLLITQDEQYWAAWVRRSNDEIRNGDFHGVESFLGALGGMGSLNDVVCSDIDATEQLRALITDAYDLATSIKHQQ